MKKIYVFQILVVALVLCSFTGSAKASSDEGTTISGDYVGALFRQQAENSNLVNNGVNAINGSSAFKGIPSNIVNSGFSAVNPSFVQNAIGDFGQASSGGGIGSILNSLLGGLSDPLKALQGFFGQQFAQIIAKGFVNADVGSLLSNSNFTGAISGVVNSVSGVLNSGVLSGDLGSVAKNIGQIGAATQSISAITNIKPPSVTAGALQPLKVAAIPSSVQKIVP